MGRAGREGNGVSDGGEEMEGSLTERVRDIGEKGEGERYWRIRNQRGKEKDMRRERWSRRELYKG